MRIFITGLIFACVIIGRAEGQSVKQASLAELASYAGADRERLLLDGAKREGKVVWYPTLPADQNKQIANAFESKYPGVKVETYRTGSSALVQRVLTEAKARRHLADVIETTMPGLLAFREAAVLQPYTSPFLGNFPEDAKEKGAKGSVYWTIDRESYIGKIS